MRAATLEELALEPSLRHLVTDFAESTGLRVNLKVELDEVSLTPELAQALYRAVQEGLTNVQRHAHAGEAAVVLTASRELVSLTIVDDGAGANGQAPKTSGYGLVGLHERVALLDGQLEVGPSPGGGSCLRITLPLRVTPRVGGRSA
jgi:two-component system, NarL family, sensor histidine kinase UhpB